MFKIVVLSDSHGSTEGMELVIAQEKPDLVIFLGDGERDIEQVQWMTDGLKVMAVRGNCDLFSDLPAFLDCSVQGIRIFATHGHLYDVKHDPDFRTLRKEAKRCGASVILFGHTHEPYYENSNRGILMNPGSIGEGFPPTYGVLLIESGRVSGKIKEI
ncbi:MAG: YfcE family phosphodiesterase [Oscillospiraceae bacterium]|nr:YfcE family phosphodiesterase [Oscillospiraceae bacterium]